MGKKIPVTITVDDEVFKKFKKMCEESDIKVSTKINTLIKEWIEENSKDGENEKE